MSAPDEEPLSDADVARILRHNTGQDENGNRVARRVTQERHIAALAREVQRWRADFGGLPKR